MQDNTYLGTEKVGTLLRKFAIPCIFFLIISCLYNIVDQIFVGNMIGYLGNAATGVIFPITVVGWGASLLFGDGAAAALSVSLGRNDTKSIHRSVGNSVLFSFLSGVVIIAVAYIGGDGLLYLIGATDANIDLARGYGNIIYLMMPFALAQNTLASIIRADGSPKYAMAAMIVGAVINIIGDPIAISFWGIEGAAIATIAGQFVSFLMCALYLRKSKTFKICKESFRPDFKLLKKMMSLGSSSFLTQISIVVITIINNVLLVKYGAMSEYGADIPLSAFVVIMKLFQIVLNIAIGIAAGAQPIVGYNYGAKRYDRVKQLLKLILAWTAIICLICTAAFEIVPQLFIKLFGTDSELYTQFASLCLRIYLCAITFTCPQKVCSIFLQSIGHAKKAAPLSVLRDVFLIVASLIAPVNFGVTGIFWAAPIADVLAILITAVVMVGTWKHLCAEEKKENVGNAEAPAAIRQSKPGTIIAISREHGTAGKHIGQLVAEKLGVPCYYKEMVAIAAKESGLAKEFISEINSNENAVMKDLYLSTAVIQQAVIAQDKAIKMIADAGACVLVGRAADYVLRDYKNVVRVFIHAPKECRLGKVMEMYGDTKAEAAESIKRSDSARSSYYKNISGMDWGDPHNYNLCLDSSIGAEACAEVICAYLKNK